MERIYQVAFENFVFAPMLPMKILQVPLETPETVNNVDPTLNDSYANEVMLN